MNGVLLRRGNLGTYSKDNVKTESREPTKRYKIYKERKYASYSRKKQAVETAHVNKQMPRLKANTSKQLL